MPMDTSAPWRALEASQGAEGEGGTASSGEAGAGSGRGMPAGRRLALAAAALLVVGSLAVAGIVALRPTGQVEVVAPLQTGGAGASHWAGASPSLAVVVVQVAGAVARPGVYSLPAGSRVADAIQAAGGYSTEVDPRAAETKLNLAAKLQDAQLIAVPRRGETASGLSGAGGGPGAGGGAGTSTTPGLTNLNTATAEQLDSLPGIGPATAQKIIASRQERAFAKVDDLVTRKIVTAAALSKLRPLVTAD
jgi:competence protein ComEA